MSARPAATDMYSRKDSVSCCVACAFSPFAAVFAIAAAVDAVLAPASAVTAAAAVDALATTAAFATDWALFAPVVAVDNAPNAW